MAEEEQTTTEAPAAEAPPVDPMDVEQQWLNLPAGPKATAMRALYEEQQKLIVELQRESMQKTNEIAEAIVRAKAARHMAKPDREKEILDTEIMPKREELRAMNQRIAAETELLNAYSSIGKGII